MHGSGEVDVLVEDPGLMERNVTPLLELGDAGLQMCRIDVARWRKNTDTIAGTKSGRSDCVGHEEVISPQRYERTHGKNRLQQELTAADDLRRTSEHDLILFPVDDLSAARCVHPHRRLRFSRGNRGDRGGAGASPGGLRFSGAALENPDLYIFFACNANELNIRSILEGRMGFNLGGENL